jgi:hypothetical protein
LRVHPAAKSSSETRASAVNLRAVDLRTRGTCEPTIRAYLEISEK